MKPLSKKYHSIFISPHIDDVIFSCGGTVAEISKTKPVLVIYVFSDYGKNTFQRKLEEEKVAKSFGYETLFLDLPDFPKRNRFGFFPLSYHRFFQKEKDQQWLRKLIDLLKATLDSIEYDQIYFPLASGMHLDHEICFRAGVENVYSVSPLFYEDLPYSFIPGLLEHRLHRLSRENILIDQDFDSRSHKECKNLSDSISDYLLGDPFFTRTGLIHMRSILKFVLKPCLKNRFNKIEKRKKDFQFEFQPTFFEIKETFDLKLTGISHYQSQVGYFFNSLQEMKKQYKGFHSKIINSKENFFERFWSICS